VTAFLQRLPWVALALCDVVGHKRGRKKQKLRGSGSGMRPKRSGSRRIRDAALLEVFDKPGQLSRADRAGGSEVAGPGRSLVRLILSGSVSSAGL